MRKPSRCNTQATGDEARDKVTRLAEILKELNEGADPAVARQEAKEFLASVSAADLSRAEQELVRGGMAPEQLRHLCALHIEMVGEKATQMATGLVPDHVMHTMLAEHEEILRLLDDLTAVNRALRHMQRRENARLELRQLAGIAQRLLDTEPHHEREEEVLFPELESRGMAAACQIIRTEHDELRQRKRQLARLARDRGRIEFDDFKVQLDTTVTMLVLTLRDHVLNENGMLYPTALEVIEDEGVWERMRAESDALAAHPHLVTPARAGNAHWEG